MKKTLLTLVALFICYHLMAQTLNWDLSAVKSSIKTLVPNILGLICFVALFGWTVWNLVTNWKDRAEITTNFAWALLTIAIGYGIVYAAMNILL